MPNSITAARTAGPVGAKPAQMSPTTTAIAPASPSLELPLRPVEGLARWLGSFLQPIAMRFVSMVEQKRETMEGPLTPNAGYFRRDRHRHPRVDPLRYRMKVSGVATPRSFSLPELRELPYEERVLVMECAGNGNHLMGSAGLVGQARWGGPSLQSVLEACGGPGDASHFAFHGLDPIPLIRKGYHYGLSLKELVDARALLALTMNGEPLPRARGFPVRMVVPGIYSMSHVKWLGHIEGKTSPHQGIHNRWVFTNKERRDNKWVRVQARWIGLKSMLTRCRQVEDGWLLTGWVWGGEQPITKVHVTTDGGESWAQAQLHQPRSYFPTPETELTDDDLCHAWSVFEYRWKGPAPGTYVVGSRAEAADGTLQRLEEDPNVRGHFNQTRVKWRRVVVPPL